jgi:antagonist of KipI
MASLRVLRPGPLTTVQDLGRSGHLKEGVSLGGALDRHGARIANLLAGNLETAALLEVTLGNAAFQFQDERVIAWCGGKFRAEIDGEQIPPGHAVAVAPGEELTIGAAERGCRLWLAISGGIDVSPILESRSTDQRAGFGGFEGRGLRVGDELALGKSSRSFSYGPRIASWSAPIEWSQTASSRPFLRILRGAEWEEFTDASQTAFLKDPFPVSQRSDRMGVRLEGAVLQRSQPNERLSEPVAPGTIQVPNDGGPILLLGDCQTIGGYPKIAHVITVDLALAAQLSPNDLVRFREVSLAQAMALFRARERDLQRFRVGLQFRSQ